MQGEGSGRGGGTDSVDRGCAGAKGVGQTGSRPYSCGAINCQSASGLYVAGGGNSYPCRSISSADSCLAGYGRRPCQGTRSIND